MKKFIIITLFAAIFTVQAHASVAMFYVVTANHNKSDTQLVKAPISKDTVVSNTHKVEVKQKLMTQDKVNGAKPEQPSAGMPTASLHAQSPIGMCEEKPIIKKVTTEISKCK